MNQPTIRRFQVQVMNRSDQQVNSITDIYDNAYDAARNVGAMLGEGNVRKGETKNTYRSPRFTYVVTELV